MKAFAPLAALALAACATVPPPAFGPTAPLGRAASIDGMSIRPLRVVEDSRCPINARCVWAGRIIVEVELAGAVPRQRLALELGKPAAVAGDGMLTLIAAEPGKLAGAETDPAAYRFTFQRG